MLRFTVVTMVGVALALGLSARADERWIIEPGPEAKDAQKLGASEVERAQKLAKEKHIDEAAAVLENVARTWPASVHDCNLALAYLRQKALTKAQLVWDLAALRNGTRPKWCTGEVSTQLSDALHKEGYVPTTLDVYPTDAVVEVNGIAMRGMRTVWLRPEPTTFNASAPGRLPKAVQVTIAAPVAKVTITLEEPQAPPPVTPDAGVQPPPMAPVDAAPMVMPPPVAPPSEAAIVPSDTASPSSSLINIGGKPVGRKTIALLSAVTFWVGAGLLGTLTYVAKSEANDHYVSDPAFTDAKNTYTALKWSTVGVAGAATIATAVYIYFLSSDDKPIPRPGTIQVTGDANGFGISYSGTFGGAR